jgi:drug/metabolite transporter (DMT)-like permease
MLFVYAVTFSYGYISLDTGTGALILFGLVQLTMIVVGAFYGNKLHFAEWLGIALAFVGVIYLVLPSLSTPSLLGFILMALSGIAWAIYTLLGRGSKQPIIDTTANFLRTIPFVLVLILLTFEYSKITDWGMIYAILSGAVTSAIGYALWYLVIKDISVTQAAVIQLLVPILAAVGGVLFVSEPISIRLVISSLLVLGGILIVIMGRRYYTKS